MSLKDTLIWHIKHIKLKEVTRILRDGVLKGNSYKG